MTVSSTQNRKSYAGNGVTTAFSFPYYFLVDSDLVVLSVNDTTGVSTTLALTTDYTVAGAGDPAGGTVNALVSPATGVTLSIYRDPAKTQLTDFVNNDDLDASTLENAFDRQTMIAQRQDDIIARSMRFPDSDPASSIGDIPNSVARANQTLIFDADGKPSAGSITSDTINAAMSDVVNAPSHAAARELLLAGMTGDVVADGSGNLIRYTTVTSHADHYSFIATDRGKRHISSAASKTWTLLAAATAGAGWNIEALDVSGGTVIASPATNLIVNGAAAAASYAMGAGEWGRLATDGTNYYLETTGFAATTSRAGLVPKATQAQANAGTADKYPSAAELKAMMFESAEITVTAGASSAVLAHGLGVKPKRFQVVLVCKTTDLGYAVGDEVAITPFFTSAAFNVQVRAINSTYLGYVIGSGAGACALLNASTGAAAAVTPANWKIVIRAWPY